MRHLVVGRARPPGEPRCCVRSPSLPEHLGPVLPSKVLLINLTLTPFILSLPQTWAESRHLSFASDFVPLTMIGRERELADLSESLCILLLVAVRHALGMRCILLQGRRDGGFFGIPLVSAVRARLHSHVDRSFMGLAWLLAGSGRPFCWHHGRAHATKAAVVTGPIHSVQRTQASARVADFYR